MKLLLRIAVGLVAIAAVGLLGLAFLPASSYAPPARDLRDEAAFQLDEKVGWYRLDDGSSRLLVRGPESGLMSMRFGLLRDSLEQIFWRTAARDSFTTGTGSAEERIGFSRAEGGAITGARWIDPDGVARSLRPDSSPAYRAYEMTWDADGVDLSGVVFVPTGPGPHPAAVFLHGSGPSDRSNFWMLSPADALARAGVAVLIPDKRGTGRSGGEWHTASFDDFARDAVAAVEALAIRPDVAPDRIGVIGFSQGGWIAPLAAASGDAAFVAAVSGSLARPSQQLVYEVGQSIQRSGAPGVLARLIAPAAARRARSRRTEWWRRNGSFDPIPYWSELDVPAAMFFGLDDRNVDVARSLDILDARLGGAESGIEIYSFEGLEHGLMSEETGWVEPEYLRRLTEWVLEATVDGGRRG